MNPTSITSLNGVTYTILKGRLVESNFGIGGLGRTTSLTTLGNILRGYRTTKSVPYTKQKFIRIYRKEARYGSKSYFAYSVKVDVGVKSVSIGCVSFTGKNAVTLRKAALKSSKVLA